MTRVRWSATEQAELTASWLGGRNFYTERDAGPLSLSLPLSCNVADERPTIRGHIERSAVRKRVVFPPDAYGPVEADTEWQHFEAHPGGTAYLYRITSVFVGAEYLDEWERDWKHGP